MTKLLSDAEIAEIAYRDADRRADSRFVAYARSDIARLLADRAMLMAVARAAQPFIDYAERIDSKHETRGYRDSCPLALAPEHKDMSGWHPTLGQLRALRAAGLGDEHE